MGRDGQGASIMCRKPWSICARRCPFRCVGSIRDNGSEFINHHLRGYCATDAIQSRRIVRSVVSKANDDLMACSCRRVNSCGNRPEHPSLRRAERLVEQEIVRSCLGCPLQRAARRVALSWLHERQRVNGCRESAGVRIPGRSRSARVRRRSTRFDPRRLCERDRGPIETRRQRDTGEE